jgi:hypothetical protein
MNFVVTPTFRQGLTPAFIFLAAAARDPEGTPVVPFQNIDFIAT